MKEDEVVEDALCPVDKPVIAMKCNTCEENGCNPDGNCIVCKQHPICEAVPKSDDPNMQQLLCLLRCCNCKL